MSSLRIVFPVPLELADALGACLFEAGAAGLEELGGALSTHVPDREHAAPLLEAFADFQARVRLLVPDLVLEPAEIEPASDDWQRTWLEALGPEHVTDSLVLRPTNHRPAPRGERTLWFEPNASFGAGGHATTRLAAAALTELCRAAPGLRLLDVGAGNGVLSFVALLEGAASALAVDVDPLAVEALGVNARLNGLDGRLEARLGSAEVTDETFSLVVANIDTGTLTALAEPLTARIAPDGALLLTGVLDEDADELAEHYLRQGLAERERRSRGGWALLVLERR